MERWLIQLRSILRSRLSRRFPNSFFASVAWLSFAQPGKETFEELAQLPCSRSLRVSFCGQSTSFSIADKLNQPTPRPPSWEGGSFFPHRASPRASEPLDGLGSGEIFKDLFLTPRRVEEKQEVLMSRCPAPINLLSGGNSAGWDKSFPDPPLVPHGWVRATPALRRT